MSYTPINQAMFVAAFSGALSAMTASIRVPTSQSRLTYFDATAIAGAWAQSFDTNWNDPTTSTELEVQLAQALSAQTWITRAPNVAISEEALTATTYDPQTLALIAIIEAGDAYVSSQTIPIPTPGGIYIPSLSAFITKLDVTGNAVSIALDGGDTTLANIDVPGLEVIDNGSVLGSGFIGIEFDGSIVSGAVVGSVAKMTFDGVLPTRTINTTNGLSGGGDLSADRTLSWNGLTVENSAGVVIGTRRALKITDAGGSVTDNPGNDSVDIVIPDLLSGATQTWNTSGTGPQMASSQATTTTTNETKTLATYALPDNDVTIITVQVTAKAATGTASGAVYSIQQAYLRDSAGAPVAMGSNVVTSVGTNSNSPPTSWTAIITTSGNNAIVQVASPAGVTVTWKVIAQEIT